MIRTFVFLPQRATAQRRLSPQRQRSLKPGSILWHPLAQRSTATIRPSPHLNRTLGSPETPLPPQ